MSSPRRSTWKALPKPPKRSYFDPLDLLAGLAAAAALLIMIAFVLALLGFVHGSHS